MRSEKELLIATKAYASENRWKSWWVLWSTLAFYTTVTWLCATSLTLWLRIPLSILSGLLIVRLFILYHDFQHRAILTRSWIAKVIMDLYGMLVLSPPSVWNRSHDHHHKHNSKETTLNSIGSFPVMTVEQYQRATPFERWSYAASRHPLTIGLGYFTVFLGGMSIRALMINPRLHFDAAVALVLHFAIGIGLFIHDADTLVLCMAIPLLLACGLGSYLFYAQHNFPGCKLEKREDWTHAAAALQSSSYLKMNPILEWFTGYIGYHHIHHLNAKIPFYRLPEAMKGLPELQKPASTTLRWADVCSCFAQNVWDAKQQQFVPYRQALQATSV